MDRFGTIKIPLNGRTTKIVALCVSLLTLGTVVVTIARSYSRLESQVAEVESIKKSIGKLDQSMNDMIREREGLVKEFRGLVDSNTICCKESREWHYNWAHNWGHDKEGIPDMDRKQTEQLKAVTARLERHELKH